MFLNSDLKGLSPDSGGGGGGGVKKQSDQSNLLD